MLRMSSTGYPPKSRKEKIPFQFTVEFCSFFLTRKKIDVSSLSYNHIHHGKMDQILAPGKKISLKKTFSKKKGKEQISCPSIHLNVVGRNLLPR